MENSMKISPRYIIFPAIIIIALLIIWTLIPKSNLEVSANTPGVQLSIAGKNYTITKTQTIKLRAGEYAYLATKSGFTTVKGFTTTLDGKTTQLKLELTKLTRVEQVYPEIKTKYPDTTVAAEYASADEKWLVVQLTNPNDAAYKHILLLSNTNGSWKVMIESQEYFTPIQIVDLPRSTQDWLGDNNFLHTDATSEEVD